MIWREKTLGIALRGTQQTEPTSLEKYAVSVLLRTLGHLRCRSKEEEMQVLHINVKLNKEYTDPK